MSETQGLKRIPARARQRKQAPAWPPMLARLGSVGLGLGLLAHGAWAHAPRAQADAKAASPPSAPASVPTIAEPPKPAVDNSYLDGPLLYQLLLAEFARNESQPADAIDLLLEAARRNKDDQLFRRALEVAVEAGAGDKALAIAKNWRQALPKSTEALRTQLQLMFALDRTADVGEPLRQLLTVSSPTDRAALISSLPRAARRAQDKTAAAEQFRVLLQPYIDQPDTRTAARVALGRMRLAAGQPGAALELAGAAQAQDPTALPPVLLALDVMNGVGGPAANAAPAAAPALAAPSAPGTTADLIPAAEAIVRRYLTQPEAEPLVRQAFAGVLAGQQRLSDAAEQLRLAAHARPTQPQLWLGLGEVELELRHPQEAEDALKRALQLMQAQQQERTAASRLAAEGDPASAAATVTAPPGGVAAPGEATDAADAPDAAESTTGPLRIPHILLLLARAAEQRHDDAAAAQWLARIDPKDADLQVIALRAALLARQGKTAQARALVRAAPATTPAELRYRLLTEVQLLLDAHQVAEARTALVQANLQTPDDIDLIYQQAMVDERLDKLDEMEALLRRILVLQPNNAQALNALGYSLADRNLRLEEALGLVKQAHELSPADPFIVDSLGWVFFRMGRFEQAATLLNQAYASRKDTEIAAHLGEALWAGGQHEQAMQVLRAARARDAGNALLQRTMARLKVAP